MLYNLEGPGEQACLGCRTIRMVTRTWSVYTVGLNPLAIGRARAQIVHHIKELKLWCYDEYRL